MSFFERFFSERGPYEANGQQEAAVCCPFLHDGHGGHYDKNPSAHVNVHTNLFHCKVCRAEGRFKDGGLSEIGFIAEVYGISYEDACQQQALEGAGTAEYQTSKTWEAAVKNLLGTAEYQYLIDERGLTPETIAEYELGFQGKGISYPVRIYRQFIDIRTYTPATETEPKKILSQPGASVMLFPFDHWRVDDRPTLLVGGENDALVARQLGFNGLTTTGGEGSFPRILIGYFKGRDVNVCYDCDETGRKSAENVAFLLKEAGANVKIVDLGLAGTKKDKDLSDFYMIHKKGAPELQAIIDAAEPFSEARHQEIKNHKYPLVSLWDVAKGENSGQRLSARVTLSGKYDMPMQMPSAIEWKCFGPTKDDVCKDCYRKGQEGWWTLDDTNMREAMYMVDVNEQQQKPAIARACGIPKGCPNSSITVRAKKEVHKVIFTPDVETEDEMTGFRPVEQYAYTLGMDLEDGARYRAFFRAYPHPLDGQRVFMIVDRVEDSDNAFNQFRMTPQLQAALAVFQGEPDKMMALRAEMAKDIVGNHAHPNVVNAVDLMYHSVMEFTYAGKLEKKGYPEGAIIGDTRTGKSSVAVPLQQFYGLGNFTAVKSATVAGLLGGADKLPSGGHKISWGMIPRNHKGLVILDEMSGVPREVLSAMTDLRSSGLASITKIVRGKAPAKTRILWMSNPQIDQRTRTTTQLAEYSSGIQLILDLVGSDEDIARFDFIVPLAGTEEYASPFDEVTTKAFDRDLYRSLIYWVWTRKAEQVKFDTLIEEYIWQVSQELNAKYNCRIRLFGPEARKKLARLAIACAGACFSCTDDGESILIKAAHVNWAADFLTRIYDNDVFRLREYVQEQRMYSTTNESVNLVVEKLCSSHPSLIKALLTSTSFYNPNNLRTIANLEQSEFGGIINQMHSNFLIHTSTEGYKPTLRLRRAVDAYREIYPTTRMIPLSEEGASPV